MSPRPLRPAPRAMRRDERLAERRFLWRVVWTALGLELVGGALVALALFATRGGTRPRPRPAPPMTVSAGSRAAHR